MLEAFHHAFLLLISGNPELWGIIQRTLQVSLSATLLGAILAIPLGIWLAFSRFPMRQVYIIGINTFMGLPPVVVGLLMYLLLSHSGPLGFLRLLFTPSAMAVTQALLAMPIIAAITCQHLEPIADRLKEFLYSLKATCGQTLWILMLEGRSAILTAVLAGFGRAIAEVGAVLIVGGNIAHETRVMTTAIALETSKGDLALAVALGIVLLSLALAVNVCGGLLQFLARYRTVIPGGFFFKNKEEKPFTLQQNLVVLPGHKHPTPSLEYSQVGVTINQHFLLQGIDCKLASTGCSVLLGHNGAGKSVFLRVGSGLLPHTQGKIRWIEHGACATPSPKRAIVFQAPVMLSRSVLANVALPLRLAGVSKQTSAQRAHEALKHCQMGHLARRSAAVCSLGERQQIAMARALVVKPRVIFMDEPTANLDPTASGRIERFVLHMKQNGVKIIMATQHLGQARRLADEIVVIHQGKLIEQTPAATFFQQPKTKEGRAFLHHELPS